MSKNRGDLLKELSIVREQMQLAPAQDIVMDSQDSLKHKDFLRQLEKCNDTVNALWQLLGPELDIAEFQFVQNGGNVENLSWPPTLAEMRKMRVQEMRQHVMKKGSIKSQLPEPQAKTKPLDDVSLECVKYDSNIKSSAVDKLRDFAAMMPSSFSNFPASDTESMADSLNRDCSGQVDKNYCNAPMDFC